MIIRTRNKVGWTLRLDRALLKRYGVLFLFIFVFASPLFNTASKGLFLAIALALTLNVKPSFSKREAKWIVLLGTLFMPAILIDCFFLASYGLLGLSGFLIIAMIIFSVVIGHRVKDLSAILAYADVVTALTFVSVILFLLAVNFPSILIFGIQYEYYGYPGISLGFQNFLMIEGIMVSRNSGFTSEPGLFQVFINIALSILFYTKKMTLTRFLILAAGIVTANSTTGLLTFAVIVLVSSNARYRIGFVLALLIGSNQVLSLFLTHYESKVLTEYAFLGRLEPMLNALDIIWQYPLGFGSVRYDQFLETLRIGSYDSYTQTLMRFGIFGFLFFIGSLVGLAKRQLGIALAIALGSATNNLPAIPAVTFLLFVDWKSLQATAQSNFHKHLRTGKGTSYET